MLHKNTRAPSTERQLTSGLKDFYRAAQLGHKLLRSQIASAFNNSY